MTKDKLTKLEKDIDLFNLKDNYIYNKAIKEFSERLIEYLQGCDTDMREALYGVDKISKEMRK